MGSNIGIAQMLNRMASSNYIHRGFGILCVPPDCLSSDFLSNFLSTQMTNRILPCFQHVIKSPWCREYGVMPFDSDGNI